MIIRWEIDWNNIVGTIKIDQSAFIRDLVIKKEPINCNANLIPMKAGLSIEITDPKDYEEADLYIY